MGISRTWARFSLLAFALTPLVAYGLPGEADAVIQHCGTPTAEHQGMSSVTNQMERDLYYNKLILHFEPAGGGWEFRSAWSNHLPVSRNGLEQRMPCFREALTQVASAPKPAIDPTIAQQTSLAPTQGSSFGVPFLWLIFGLAVVLAVFVAIPARRRKVRGLAMEERPFRRPRVVGFRFRRRPAVPKVIPKPADL